MTEGEAVVMQAYVDIVRTAAARHDVESILTSGVNKALAAAAEKGWEWVTAVHDRQTEHVNIWLYFKRFDVTASEVPSTQVASETDQTGIVDNVQDDEGHTGGAKDDPNV